MYPSPASSSPPATTISTAARSPPPSPACTSFTGRVAERARLADLLGLASASEGAQPSAVVAIQALGGMGKSALARRMVQTVADQTGGPFARVVWCSFYESRSDDEAAALRDLLEALSVEPPAVPEGLAAAEPLRRHLCIALDRQPVLLVLDGLEVITTRLSLTDLRGGAGFTDLPLATFSDAEAADLWQRIGVTGERAELEQAVRAFSGHPLALRAAGLYLQERAIPAREVERLVGDAATFRGSSEAERIKRIVDAHREHLTEPQQHFLKMLAIHPRAVRLAQHTALLHPEVRDWPELRIEEELVLPLIRYGLIERLDDGGRRHCSADPLMKLAFGTWLDPEGSRRAHAEWAEAAKGSPDLAASPGRARSLDELRPWLDLVEHYLDAGAFEAAWDMWGDRRVDQRLNHLGYALQLLRLGRRFERASETGGWQPTAGQRNRLFELLGQACHNLDRQRDMMVYREKQYAAARETGNATVTAVHGALLAESNIDLGRLAPARQLLEELRPQAEGLPEGESSAIYRSMASKAALFCGDYAAAQSGYVVALRHGSPSNLISRRTYLAEAQLRSGQLAAAKNSLEQAREKAERAQIPDLLPAILRGLTWLALKHHDIAAARDVTERRIALQNDLDRPHEDDGLLLVQEGRHSEALTLAAAHISEPAGEERLDKDAEIQALLVTAQAHHGLGEPEPARAALERARALMEQTGCWRCKDWLAETEALLAPPKE